ncbi:MAG TPA: hypothetical protein VF443_02145 [Nitrospira sp.]
MGIRQAGYGIVLVWLLPVSLALGGALADIQEHGNAMIRDAEEMVMHGGMGDGKAILHHCSEVAGHAETILKLLPASDEHGKEAAPLLKEAIADCKRVAEMGDKVDPGASLNPAVKARAAARAAMKHLKEVREHGA